MKYDIFLVDVDETILDFASSERKALKQTLKHFNRKIKKDDYITYHEINKGLWKQYEKDEITYDKIFSERFKRFFEKLSKQAPENIDEIYFGYLAKGAHMIKGAKCFLRQLNKIGKVYILTNGRTLVQKSRMKLSKLDRLVEKVFVSEEASFKKPEPQIFEYAAERIENFSKDRCVMIGDSLSPDILGGNNFGIDTIHFSKHYTENEIKPTFYAKTYKEILDFIKNS